MPRKAACAFDKGVNFLLVKQQPLESLPYFQKAIELAPNLFPAYHNIALAQYKLRRFDDAAKNFEKAIALSKGSFASSFVGLALTLYGRGQVSEAQRVVQHALLVDPLSANGKYCLGLTQYSLGRTADAQSSAFEALAIDPRLADAHLLLAHVHERLHDPNAVVADVNAYFHDTSDGSLRADALALLQRAQQDLATASLH
jgi:tetratricopeptide (TPR) repeat protein